MPKDTLHKLVITQKLIFGLFVLSLLYAVQFAWYLNLDSPLIFLATVTGVELIIILILNTKIKHLKSVNPVAYESAINSKSAQMLHGIGKTFSIILVGMLVFAGLAMGGFFDKI